MRSWELIGAQELHWILLETDFLSQEWPHGSQEPLISTNPHEGGFTLQNSKHRVH